MTLTCATYNILHGRYKDMILENIRLLSKEGVDIFCLQETSPEFEKEVLAFLKHEGFMHWRAQFVHAGAGGHVGLLWNTYKLSLTQSQTIALPSLGHPSNLQRVRGNKNIYQRVALLGQFRFGGKRINIVSTHLAWEGGFLHRFKQVQSVRKALDAYPADADIVGGDFNTIGPKIAARLQKKPIEKIFGPDFFNAHPHIKWSFDTSFSDPLDTWGVAKKFRTVGVRWRSRLDYMFCRNLKNLKADMYDLPGSDHRPLVATFAPVGELARLQ
jgi:endonuclease/exonuclease/phosphatase family metal-dependent hydrolase